MQEFLYDARNVKVYEYLCSLGEYAGQEKEWIDTLWKDLLVMPDLYEEMVYYLMHHSLRDQIRCHGYSLTDLYVWQMSQYNLILDTGKNTPDCNKETLVLRAFRTMIELSRNPEIYLKRIRDRRGMDLF